MKSSKERKSCAFIWEIRETKTLCYKNKVQEYKSVFPVIYQTEAEALEELKEEFSYRTNEEELDDWDNIKILESHIDFDSGICYYSYIHKTNTRQYPIHKVTLQVSKRRRKKEDMTVEEFFEYCSYNKYLYKRKLKDIINYGGSKN